jgi:hypothetical protein
MAHDTKADSNGTKSSIHQSVGQVRRHPSKRLFKNEENTMSGIYGRHTGTLLRPSQEEFQDVRSAVRRG